MPKIVIKEIDKTASEPITDNGFSVVIPGFVKTGTRPDSSYEYGYDDNGNSVFDENGIYTCNNKAAFEKYIGKISSIKVNATAPTISIRRESFTFDSYSMDGQTQYATGTGTSTSNTIKIDNTEYIEVRVWQNSVPGFNNTLAYIAQTDLDKIFPISTQMLDLYNNKGEKLNIKVMITSLSNNAIDNVDKLYYYTVTAEEFYETYRGILYTRSDEQGSIGYLHDDGHKYELATEYDENTEYCIIKQGEEGNDAMVTTGQCGNQIADILLNLGYTVLYLKLNTIDDLANSDTFEPLKDRSIYNFRYIISGLIDNVDPVTVETVNIIIKDLASYINKDKINNPDDFDINGRGDCIALTDIAKNVYDKQTSINAVMAIKDCPKLESTYAAYFAPTVLLGVPDDVEYNNNKEFPASVFYLACAAASFKRYPAWFAVSGYTRGVCPYKVLGTSVKLGDTAVNILQPRTVNPETATTKTAVNLIVNLNNSYYLWGNRTAYTLGDELVASHFLNIRQLCCTLKKAIYNTCRSLTFDPNTDILWLNFCNSLRPVLEEMKNNQGIKDYKFEKKDTNVKAKLFAAIRIIPIEAVEDFEIGLTLENDFDETLITIEESLVS